VTALLDELALLPPGEDAAALATATDEELGRVLYGWEGVRARPNQLPPPGDWRVWLLLAGRGFGKSRTGAEWVRSETEAGRRWQWAFVGATAADVRDIMVEGDSGILRISPPWFRPEYEPSKRRLTWPNGAVATLFSGDEPDQLRGPNRDGAWADEVAKWKHAREAWDNLELVLRAGSDPRCVVTTTPKPIAVVRELLTDPLTTVTRGSTYDNAANLAPSFLRRILGKYEGTRLGRQELHAELLDDIPGALWQRAMLDDLRVAEAPELQRIVVAVDPAVTSGEDSDETGIVVAGKGIDGHGYVLADLTCRLSPDGWARRAVQAYHTRRADMLVAEVNNGGELVETTIRTVDPLVAYKAVRASRGKRVRAEPVAALYEQGRVHHVGSLADLEDQQCNYTPDGYDGSPDRVDALVYALTELLLEPHDEPIGAMTFGGASGGWFTTKGRR
jgi:phage terminase large subunit-like protein